MIVDDDTDVEKSASDIPLESVAGPSSLYPLSPSVVKRTAVDESRRIVRIFVLYRNPLVCGILQFGHYFVGSNRTLPFSSRSCSGSVGGADRRPFVKAPFRCVCFGVLVAYFAPFSFFGDMQGSMRPDVFARTAAVAADVPLCSAIGTEILRSGTAAIWNVEMHEQPDSDL
jgi:hypothetical protein